MTAAAVAVAVAVALVASLCYALAAALQQHAAGQAETPGGLRLLGHLLTQRRWLAGVAAMVAGGCLHVLALRLGPLALVQPIGVTGLVFALPVGAALHGHRVVRGQLIAAAAVAAGLVAVLGAVRLPVQPPTVTGAGIAVLAGTVGAVVLGCGLFGRRLPTQPRAVTFALGAGICFGVTSALVRLMAVRAGQLGLAPAVVDWPTLVLLAAAGAGLSLAQSGYQIGSLGAVLPAVTVADPVAAVVVGQLLLGEPIRVSGPGAALAGAGVAVLVAGAVVLSRHRGREPGAAHRSSTDGRIHDLVLTAP
jgi:drug/metabolite transporter (DMT)-like permease